MKFNAAKRLLKLMLVANLPMLLTGAPGVGKTDLVHTAKKELGYDIQISHPVIEDPTDVKGYPYAEDGKAGFLPYGHLATALAATRPLIWFLDDLGQASPAVQAAYMQLLLLREVGGHKLPDCVRIVAASNRKQDRAGVSGMLEPVKSRFVTIVNVEPDLDSWIDWSLREGLPYAVIGFLQLRGDELLHKPSPTTDLVNSPSPRTWHNLAQQMMAGVTGEEEGDQEAFEGSVGKEAATEFRNSLVFMASMPSVDDIRLNPEASAIPTNTSVLYALASAIATATNKSNFAAFLKYLMRMDDAGYGEMASFAIKKAVLKTPALTQAAAYKKAITGPMASLMQ